MASKPIEADIPKRNLKHRPQYAESFIIVWLNTALKINDHAAKIIEQLEVISNDVEVFDDSNACIDYITELKHEHVLLIISDLVHQCILTLAQDLPVISALYILYSSDVTNHEKWSEPIPKVKGIFNNV